VADTLEWTNGGSNTSSSSDRGVRLCGEKAETEGYDFFGLNMNLCILGHDVSEDSLEICTKERSSAASPTTLELYRITDWKEFDLSVRVYDSCGAEFCCSFKGAEVSSASATYRHLTLFSFFSFLLLLLS